MLVLRRAFDSLRGLRHPQTMRLMVLLLLLSIPLVAVSCITAWAVAKKGHDSFVLNVAGRQRALIERFTRQTNQALVALAVSDWSTLLAVKAESVDTAKLFRSTHQAFLEGGVIRFGKKSAQSLSIPRTQNELTRQRLAEVSREWAELLRAANLALRSAKHDLRGNEYVKSIQARCSSATSAMDSTVSHIQYDSEQKLRRIETFVHWQIVVPLDRTSRSLDARRIELESANEELEKLVYVASHDLQEPLRMFIIYSEMMARHLDGKLDSKATKYLRYATEGAQRMHQLIRGLLAYLDLLTKTGSPRRTNVSSIVEQAVSNLETDLRESGGEVTVGSLPTVEADPGQLLQAFQNLIDNAIKFHGSEPPRVHVSVERNGSSWIFAVSDNGIGIEPKYADRIFMIFQRLHQRGKYSGSGVGLALVKKIVGNHGGKVAVESKLGNGSCFRFTLPAVPEPEGVK